MFLIEVHTQFSKMKPTWIALTCGIACLVGCDSGDRESAKSTTAVAPAMPASFLIEAESCDSAPETVSNDLASGSSYVQLQAGPSSEPLLCEIPVSKKKLTIWVRRSGGPVRVKAPDAETKSSDQSTKQFVWTEFGEIDPGPAGRKAAISASDDKSPFVSVDCVLFAEGPIGDKDALLTPLPTVVIDPTNHPDALRASPRVWGVHILSEASFPKGLSESPVGIVHVGGSQETNGLFDIDQRKWDENQVRAIAEKLSAINSASEISISIPLWPAWLDADTDGLLDHGGIDEYAGLTARFTEIIRENTSVRNRIRFEILDGCDDAYYTDPISKKQPHRVAELAQIYLTAAFRIHEVAPDAKLGGPSARDSANTGFHEQFVAYTAPALDFFSVHFPTDESLVSLPATVEMLRGILDKNSGNRVIPLSLNAIPAVTNEAEEVRAAISAYIAGADSATILSGKNDALWMVTHAFFSGPIAVVETVQPEHISVITSKDGECLLIAHTGLRDRKISLPDGEWSGTVLGEDASERELAGEIDLLANSVLFLKRK